MGTQQVDLSLLQGRELDGPLSAEWVAGHVQVDRTVEFGSDAYFRLAADPLARPFLQSGTNVVFAFGGEIIAVRGPEGGGLAVVEGQVPARDPAPAGPPSARSGLRAPLALPAWLLLLLAGVAMAALTGSAGVAALVYYAARRRR